MTDDFRRERLSFGPKKDPGRSIRTTSAPKSARRRLWSQNVVCSKEVTRQKGLELNLQVRLLSSLSKEVQKAYSVRWSWLLFVNVVFEAKRSAGRKSACGVPCGTQRRGGQQPLTKLLAWKHSDKGRHLKQNVPRKNPSQVICMQSTPKAQSEAGLYFWISTGTDRHCNISTYHRTSHCDCAASRKKIMFWTLFTGLFFSTNPVLLHCRMETCLSNPILDLYQSGHSSSRQNSIFLYTALTTIG